MNEPEPNLGDPRTCVDCQTTFTLNQRDQEFYAEMMSKDAQFRAPKRCKPCLQKRKIGQRNKN